MAEWTQSRMRVPLSQVAVAGSGNLPVAGAEGGWNLLKTSALLWATMDPGRPLEARRKLRLPMAVAESDPLLAGAAAVQILAVGVALALALSEKVTLALPQQRPQEMGEMKAGAA